MRQHEEFELGGTRIVSYWQVLLRWHDKEQMELQRNSRTVSRSGAQELELELRLVSRAGASEFEEGKFEFERNAVRQRDEQSRSGAGALAAIRIMRPRIGGNPKCIPYRSWSASMKNSSWSETRI